MTHRVELLPDAAEDLRDLDRDTQRKVFSALKKLQNEPGKRGQPLGSKSRGNLTSFRKLVVGKQELRIIYRVETETIVVVWVIAARADDHCYELAYARVQTHPNSDVRAQLAGALESTWGRKPG